MEYTSGEDFWDKDIQALVDAGDWHLNENAITSFREEKYGLYDIGVVYYGNDKISMTLCESYGNIKLEYTHQGPLNKYNSDIAREETFDIKVKSDELDPVFHRRIYNYGDKEFSMDLLDKGIPGIKAAICNAFTEDGVLSVKASGQYKTIRDNGTSFFKQVDKAINTYIKELIQKPKLSTEELYSLARYYDNKVIDGLENNRQGKINTVKRMLEDGLKPSQICIIGSNMDSVYTGNPNWPKEILKLPEIQEFQNQLSSKRLNPVCSRTK